MYNQIKEIDVSQLHSWLADNPNSIRVIDVREPREFAAGALPAAELMPLATLPMRAHEISDDKPTVLVCRSGARSAQACAFLMMQGLQNVFNLRGGMMAWARSPLALATG